MPHILIEYSVNVAEVTDLDALMRAVHQRAIATGIAPADALRTRLVPRERYLIADDRPENKFLAVTARLGAGRSADEKRRFVAELLDALEVHLGDAQADTAISVEFQEIDPAFRLNKNGLRARIESSGR